MISVRAEQGLVTPGGEDGCKSHPTSSPRPDALFKAYDKHTKRCGQCGRGHYRSCPEGNAIRDEWLQALESEE